MSKQIDKYFFKSLDSFVNWLSNQKANEILTYYNIDDNNKIILDIESMEDEFNDWIKFIEHNIQIYNSVEEK
jgi:hypothetical protein